MYVSIEIGFALCNWQKVNHDESFLLFSDSIFSVLNYRYGVEISTKFTYVRRSYKKYYWQVDPPPKKGKR